MSNYRFLSFDQNAETRRWIRALAAAGFIATLAGVSNTTAAPGVYRDRIEPHWFDDNSKFWYRNDNPDQKREFILVDVVKGTRGPAFNHTDVANQIGDGATAESLPINELEFREDGVTVLLKSRDRSWNLSLDSGRITIENPGDGSPTGLAPDNFIRPSRNGGEESGITFENQLDRPVKLFWIDTSGNRQAYGEIEPGQQRSQHTFENHVWLITDTEGELIAAFTAEAREAIAVIDGISPPPRERRRGRGGPRTNATTAPSPNGQWEAFVRDDNLWIRRTAGGLEKQLSADASAANSFHRDAIRSRAVGMRFNTPDFPASLPEVHWAPNSRFVLALQTSVVPEPRVTLVESSPEDQVQPKLQSYPYIKPGDPIPQATLRLFDVELGVELPVDQSVLNNPWSIGRFSWRGRFQSIDVSLQSAGPPGFESGCIKP